MLQSVQEQAKVTIRAAIRPVLEEFLEAEVTAKLGREKGEDRRIRSQPPQIDWQCGKCGCADANQFIRDGHYRRGLATGWGYLSNLRVPMVECQECGHDVMSHFARHHPDSCVKEKPSKRRYVRCYCMHRAFL